MGQPEGSPWLSRGSAFRGRGTTEGAPFSARHVHYTMSLCAPVGDINLDPLDKVVPSRFLHCQVIISTLNFSELGQFYKAPEADFLSCPRMTTRGRPSPTNRYRPKSRVLKSQRSRLLWGAGQEGWSESTVPEEPSLGWTAPGDRLQARPGVGAV